ncbi:hypothetical protein [Botrimarina hoheduenensis]|uniref:Transposase n=1 Tax=Botrimarina hoheduenensis TaxID=2528000 RepID=A0A5C5VUZ5_9BACT|nr:hypothetical protein [Botrimarina hoheduenensis]TWT41342.1 hypothetical protein Pla111_30560 [Botrimarina hoheduenensis]
MAAYSSDLRERVFEAYQSGLSSPQVAERFGVSWSSPLKQSHSD